MENILTRYRNVTVLVAILFAQVLGLAVQVKRTSENESTRLIRIWAVSAVTPFEKAIVWFRGGVGDMWRNYVYLRGVRQENRELKDQIEKLRLEQVRLNGDAEQARRLQLLLGFKEQFISKTIAAQVIGSSGSEQSRSVYIDKGTDNGIDKDMPVITADGVVGKVLRVFGSTSQVLLIDDQSSGVGAILERSRLQGVLRGTPAGEVVLEKVMSDEQVLPGEKVLTSGGDQIFPKGLPVGVVTKVSPGPDLFLNIRVRPATNLSKLEEVLVITQQEEKAPSVTETGPMRAVDILAQRLPSVPDKPSAGANKPAGADVSPAAQSGVGAVNKPSVPATASPPKGTDGDHTATSAAGTTKPAGSNGAVPASKLPTPTVKPAAVKVSGQTTNPATETPKTKSTTAGPQAAPEDKPR
jgi:rod shape-determining protein MreC